MTNLFHHVQTSLHTECEEVEKVSTAALNQHKNTLQTLTRIIMQKQKGKSTIGET